jgi:O-succinylhomoserine sulfhydrylase
MKRRTGMDRSITKSWRPATQAIRGGAWRSNFDETSEALYLTSGFSYEEAEEAAARFRGEREGFTYSRQTNPSVSMLEERLCLLEGAEACKATATGMAAMSAALLCQLQAGDHVVASRALFGSCRWLVDTLLPRYGIATTVIDGRDTQAWADARKPNTKLFFLESPANPTLDIVDLRAVSDLAHAIGARVVVDNVFASPVLQKPMDFGADIVCYSATKHMDGQGRVLGGAILGSAKFVEDELYPFLRHTGPMLSPFNAWVIHKGLETMALRVERMAANAARIAQVLHPRIPTLRYPGHPAFAQHALAMQQMKSGGTVLTLEVDGGRDVAFKLLDALQIIDISNNIGDSRSLMTHPSSTTHRALSEEARLELGIREGLLRLSVGLEDVDDLLDDLSQALEAISR